MSSGFSLALAALVPVMLGPHPAEHRTITATLCNGGTITIPLGDDAPADDSRNCHPEGCHAGTCRQKNEQKATKRTN